MTTSHKQLPAWVFWPVSLTFVWALLAMPWGLTRIIKGNIGFLIFVFGYTATCFTAGMILTRVDSKIGTGFMVTNFVLGVGWIPFALWMIITVAKNLWH
jgi:hypothetical protein